MITDKRHPVALSAGRPAHYRWPPPQALLPAVQLVSVALWAFLGRHGLGLAGSGLVVFSLAMPLVLHVSLLSSGFLRAALGSGRPARDWWIAWFSELPNTLRVYYGLLPWRAGFAAPSPAAPARLPILFLHGYGCNRGIWWPAVRWFTARGHPVEAIDLSPLFTSIDAYVPAIQAGIDRLRAAHGGRPVAIVAHSMGGLAARVWLRDCRHRGAAPGLAALITLASPHQGTAVASWGFGENTRQMRAGSAWLTALASDESAAAARAPDAAGPRADIHVTTLIGWNDNIVLQPASQRLPGARAIFVRRIGHLRIATATRILQLVERLLVRAARTHGPLAAESASAQPGRTQDPVG